MAMDDYELVSDWKNSTSGKIAKAKKGGKIYFLKKYQTPVAPIDNGSLDAKTMERNQKEFDEFVRVRTEVNNLIRDITGSGGNIIIPCEEFIDGNQFVEASEFVEGIVPDEEYDNVLKNMPKEQKDLALKTAIGALMGVHKKGIVHVDLKIQNVLLVKNKSGSYVSKLVDFDHSFFDGKVPEDLGGTIDYLSPELGICTNVDLEERGKYEEFLTTKTDIFSMGLIFHYYLAGELPEAINLNPKLQAKKDKGRKIYCWVALTQDCDIQVSDKIPKTNYFEAICEMLQKNPDYRPTAAEVLKMLQGPGPKIGDLWPEHSSLKLKKERIKELHIIGFKKYEYKEKKLYKVLYENGKLIVCDIDELCEIGITKKDGPVWPPLWPEHHGVLNIEKIKSRGYVSGEQKIQSGMKGYLLFKSDDSEVFINESTMRLKQFITGGTSGGTGGRTSGGTGGRTGGGTSGGTGGRTSGGTGGGISGVEPHIVKPRKEDHIEFDEAAIHRKGYIRVEPDSEGIGYMFTKEGGKPQLIPISTIVQVKMAKRI